MPVSALYRDESLTTSFKFPVSTYFRDDCDSDKHDKYHRQMMRDGSAALLWAVARLQAQREGPLAIQRFEIMRELAI
jgi:hypothetical protein